MREVVAGVLGCVLGILGATLYFDYKGESSKTALPLIISFRGIVASHDEIKNTVDIQLTGWSEGEPPLFDTIRFRYDEDSIFVNREFIANGTESVQGVKNTLSQPNILKPGKQIWVVRDQNSPTQARIDIATVTSFSP